MKCLWNKSRRIRVRWRFTSERERIGDAFSSRATLPSGQCNFRRLWSSIFPTRLTTRESWLFALFAFCAQMPASTASNFDRVFGPLWIVLAEWERRYVPRDGKVPLKAAFMIGRNETSAISYHLRGGNLSSNSFVYLSSNTLFFLTRSRLW